MKAAYDCCIHQYILYVCMQRIQCLHTIYVRIQCIHWCIQIAKITANAVTAYAKKLCNTCMATFHTRLTVGPIRCFTFFYYLVLKCSKVQYYNVSLPKLPLLLIILFASGLDSDSDVVVLSRLFHSLLLLKGQASNLDLPLLLSLTFLTVEKYFF